MPTTITNLTARDIRFPTSKSLDGSDAMNPDPDYSCVYVTLHTDGDHEGSGRASIPPPSHDNARRARGRARSGERRKKGSRRPWNQARRRELNSK